jgi:acyl-CoA thioesterase I
MTPSMRPIATGLRRTARNAQRTCIGAALLITGPNALLGQEPASRSPAETCLQANRSLSLGAPLPRTAAHLKTGGPLRVVVIGSSSTSGLWVLNSAATYPEVMRRELARLRPSTEIRIINSGRIGDTIAGTMVRFQRDVLSHSPDLVVWQLGTNDVAWGGRTDGLKNKIIEGVRALKANGPDVILMDLQYAPLVLASSHHSAMQAIIAEVARQERVGLFPRYELMRRSIEAGLSPGALLSWDTLHNSADGYDCIGRALARAVHAAAR